MTIDNSLNKAILFSLFSLSNSFVWNLFLNYYFLNTYVAAAYNDMNTLLTC